MEKYVVRYHPEGWRSVKDEPPETEGMYYCADANNREYGISWWTGDKWESVFTNCELPVTHWQPLPTPPWDIFPKEAQNV